MNHVHQDQNTRFQSSTHHRSQGPLFNYDTETSAEVNLGAQELSINIVSSSRYVSFEKLFRLECDCLQF